MEKRNSWKPEKLCVIGSCAAFDFDFSKESFHSVKEKGFDGVVFGYLDGNWDAEFSRIDMYSESPVIPCVIPHTRVEANRFELRRRIDLATAEGLRVYMSVRGPMTRTDLANIDSNRAWVHRKYFGPGGDKWGGSGKEPMCLSNEKVREHYRLMFQDVEERFPELAGFMFFGGDSFALICDRTCPRCGSAPEYQRWGQWISDLCSDAGNRGVSMKFDIMNWPWWDDMFKMAEFVHPEVGFIAVNDWGFSFGKREDGKYPSILEKWEMQEYQSDCLRLPVTDHETALGLSQGWFGTPMSDSFKKLASICQKQGRRLTGWAHLICSESIWPYCMPSPKTTVQRLEEFREIGTDGVFDLWGIDANIIYDRKKDANTTAFATFFQTPDTDADTVLQKTAEKLYGTEGVDLALKAWDAVDNAISHWAIVAYSQRMHWALRRLFPHKTRTFYVLNLTLPLDADPDPDKTPFWPDFLKDPAMWDRLAQNLSLVLAGYDDALDFYNQMTEQVEEQYKETAIFHRDCLLLGRTYHQIGWESAIYQANGLRNIPLDKDFMKQAVDTRKLCRHLYKSLQVVPYEDDGMDEVLNDMEAYAAGE